MSTASFAPRILVRTAIAAAAALLLTACSAEDLVGRVLSQVEGVDSVDFDFSEEGGHFTITGDDGETFGIEIDDQGQSTITTDEGTMTTAVDGEIPAEVAAALDLPASFEAAGSATTDTEDGRAIILMGEVTGSYAQILDELQASLEARWANVERAEMAPGQMGAITAQDADEDRGVQINLIMEQDQETGVLQIMIINP